MTWFYAYPRPQMLGAHFALVRSRPLAVPCPPGLHRGTYRRLLREYDRLLGKLAELPTRRLAPRMRKAYQRQFENRILRIRRRLRLPMPQPRVRRWYRVSEAALFLGISAKTLVRWSNRGLIRCRAAGFRTHRYYAAAELARIRGQLKV